MKTGMKYRRPPTDLCIFISKFVHPAGPPFASRISLSPRCIKKNNVGFYRFYDYKDMASLFNFGVWFDKSKSLNFGFHQDLFEAWSSYSSQLQLWTK
jgi:hypothetical protein